MPRRALLGPLVGAAGVISLLTLTARVVGFARWFAQSAWVGTGEFANAYATANQIPNVAYEVAVGGALAGMTIPLISAPLAKGHRGEADRVTSVLFTWALLILVPLAVLTWAVAPGIAAAFPVPSGADEAAQGALITTFLRIFSVQIPLYGVCAVATGALQAHEKFFLPSLTPLLSSLGVIATYAAFGWVSGGVHNVATVTTPAVLLLGWGTTLGVALLSLPLLVPLRRHGIRVRPAVRLAPDQARLALGLGSAGVIGLLAQQVAVVVVLWVARRYGGASSLPVYQYAQAVYLLPYAVGAVPIATAMFPRLAKSLDDRDQFRVWCARSSGLVALFGLAGSALLAVEADAAEGVFAIINPVPGMREGLWAMAPGLFAYALLFHLTRVLYALGRARAVVVATSLGWVSVAAASAGLAAATTGWGSREVTTLVSLGAAQSLGMIVGAGGLAVAVARACPGGLAGLSRTLTLGAAGSAVAVLLALGGDALVTGGAEGIGWAFARAGLGVVVTAAVFGYPLLRAVRRCGL